LRRVSNYNGYVTESLWVGGSHFLFLFTQQGKEVNRHMDLLIAVAMEIVKTVVREVVTYVIKLFAKDKAKKKNHPKPGKRGGSSRKK